MNFQNFQEILFQIFFYIYFCIYNDLLSLVSNHPNFPVFEQFLNSIFFKWKMLFILYEYFFSSI